MALHLTTAQFLGYGDLTPHTQEERFLAIFFIPLACAVTGHCLAFFAKWIIERQGARYRRERFDSHKELSPKDLRVMDITGGESFIGDLAQNNPSLLPLRTLFPFFARNDYMERWQSGMV
jgi:hypothetical protein